MDGPAEDIEDAGGYSVRYDTAKGWPRVYLMLAIGAVLCTAGFIKGSEILFAIGLGGLAAAYYFYPLVESRKARLGANEYGIFIEGLGLIAWRSIRTINLVTTCVRSIELHELQIQLNETVSKALLVDWRRVPFYRSLMRLPWSVTADNTIRIGLEPFAQPPQAIHRRLEAMWRQYLH